MVEYECLRLWLFFLWICAVSLAKVSLIMSETGVYFRTKCLLISSRNFGQFLVVFGS